MLVRIVVFGPQAHHLAPGINIFLGHISPERDRIMTGHAFHRLVEFLLLLLEIIHTLPDKVGKTLVRASIVITDESLEIVV